MNFHKAKILLEKINRLYTGMSLDSDNVSPIERDLMMSYIREFYEVFHLEKARHLSQKMAEKPIAKPIAPTPPPVKKVEPIAPPPVKEPVKPEPVVVKAPEPVQEVKTVVTPPPVVHQPVAPPPPKPPVASPPPVVEQPPVAPPPPKEEPPKREIKKFNFIPPKPRRPVVNNPTPPPPPVSKNNGDVDIFDTKSGNDVSSRFGLSKIDDLRRAFGLNDKMMYTNELFGGNNNVFKETMEQLNSFVTFNQAKDYLMKNVAMKYNWTSKTKSKLAKDFIKTVSRKYL